MHRDWASILDFVSFVPFVVKLNTPEADVEPRSRQITETALSISL